MIGLLTKKNIDKFFEILYCVSLVFVVFNFSYEHVWFAEYDGAFHLGFRSLRIYPVILLLLKIIYDIFAKKFNKIELVLIFFLIPICIFSAIIHYDFDPEIMMYLQIVIYFELIIASRDIDYQKIIKLVFVSYMISHISILILFLLNFLRVYVHGSFDNRFRQAIGFSWFDIAHRYLFMVLYFVYIRKKLITNIELIILLITNCFILYFAGGRAGFFFVFSILVISFIQKKFYNIIKYNRIFSILIITCVIMIPIVNILLSYFYNEDIAILAFINKVLSGRLRLAQNGFSEFGVKLFGDFQQFIGGFAPSDKYNYVDSGYLNFLFTYGIIPFIIYICYLLYFAILINRKKDIYMFYIFIIILVYSFNDEGIFNLLLNYFFLALSYKYSSISDIVT